TENVLSFAVAYGLALQGLGLTRVETNLLPDEIASRRRWARKRGWFAAAASLVVAATVAMAARGHMDKKHVATIDTEGYRTAQMIQSEYSRYRSEYQSWGNRIGGQTRQAEDLMSLL